MDTFIVLFFIRYYVISREYDETSVRGLYRNGSQFVTERKTGIFNKNG